jgi:hypothetical protein
MDPEEVRDHQVKGSERVVQVLVVARSVVL